ncbi:MAG: hypothetical protein VZR73_13740, partial [Acutalibacteraceae bacterium]|nr:hypothetical protein [Acutalibacteraceae bacterium]
MTMNSIEYITKKHFRSVLNILLTLVTVAISVLSVGIAYVEENSPAFVFIAAFSVFAVLSALFAVVRIFSVGKGCTLMRISIGLTAVLFFFSAMGMFTTGYLMLRNNGIHDRLNAILSDYGYSIALGPTATGTLMFAGSVLLYMASGCAFFGHRYLGSVRSCSAGTIRRSGLRVFPAASLILVVLSIALAGAIAALSSHALASGRVISDLMSHQICLLLAILVVLLFLHLLLAGICARSFARKTYAFKVFEHQIMKVETNADGTVYVPINEDVEPDADEPLVPAKNVNDAETPPSGKPYIMEYPVFSSFES